MVGFESLVEEVLVLLARRDPPPVCLVGPSGSGRSTALRLLGRRLGEQRAGAPAGGACQLIRGEDVARGDAAQRLGEVPRGVVALVDDLELLLWSGSTLTDSELAGAVRGMIGGGRRAVFALDAAFRGRLRQSHPELYDELAVVVLPDLPDDQLGAIGRLHAASLGAYHGVPIDDGAVTRAAARSATGSLRAHPGLLVDRLDHAAARAARTGRSSVGPADIDLGEGAAPPATNGAELFAALKRRVVGQDAALRAISERISLTSVGLDLRPARPNAIFLLAGPTGVGKTAIAIALAETLFSSTDALIRLDLSEFGDRSSVNRLFGPPPGYLGSDAPEGWLTSRVLSRPRSLVLLDEVEKAAPEVWNVFLQIFDAGRLTDSSGTEVSFADTVVVLTSNLGAAAFTAGPAGFQVDLADGSAKAVSAVGAAVRSRLPPEFVNRLDAVLVCQPLGVDAISEILGLELDRALPRLRERGWELTVSEAARAALVGIGYDPAFGARHLQRNIDRLVLSPLVGRPPGAWTLDATPELAWRPSA